MIQKAKRHGQPLAHRIKKSSDWWNLWDQSLTAAYLFRWGAFGRRNLKYAAERLTGFAEMREKSEIYRLGRYIVRQWQTLVQPYRSKLQFQRGLEYFCLALLTLLPVLRNAYPVTLGLILLLLYNGVQPHRRLYGFIGLSGLFFGVALLSPGFRAGWDDLAGLLNGLMIAYCVGSAFRGDLARKSIRYLVAFSMVLMAVGFWQRWIGFPTSPGWLEPTQIGQIGTRIFSIFANPNVYAIYLTGILILASHLWLESAGTWRKPVWGGITVSAILSLYLTYSRSGWLIALVYLGWFLSVLRAKKMIRPAVAGVVLVAVLLLLNDTGTRLAGLGNLAETTLGYRTRIWQGTIRALPDFWLWGAGPGGFARIYPYYMGNTLAVHAHQWYLQFWLEYGLIGLAGFAWFMLRLLRPFPTAGFPRALGITLICFLGFGLVESWYIQPFLGNFFWLLAGLFLASQPEGRSE